MSVSGERSENRCARSLACSVCACCRTAEELRCASSPVEQDETRGIATLVQHLDACQRAARRSPISVRYPPRAERRVDGVVDAHDLFLNVVEQLLLVAAGNAEFRFRFDSCQRRRVRRVGVEEVATRGHIRVPLEPQRSSAERNFSQSVMQMYAFTCLPSAHASIIKQVGKQRLRFQQEKTPDCSFEPF